MNRLVAIGEAAEVLGVSITTLRRWEAEGKLIPEHTTGKHRRYDLAKLKPELFRAAPDERRTIAYACVSSREQADNLERQILESYCSKQGWTFDLICDLGSGINYHNKGLKRLLKTIIEGQVGRLVITHKGRLSRLGGELIFTICEIKNVEVVILNQGEDISFEEDFTHDVLDIVRVFSARFYGLRSTDAQKLLDSVMKVVEDLNKC